MPNGPASRKGRNRILSVQFYLIGPTGEVLTLVIHIENGDIVSQRPRLSDVIYDLLESALDQGVIEEWPAEVVLCGFYPRRGATAFSDFKHLLPAEIRWGKAVRWHRRQGCLGGIADVPGAPGNPQAALPSRGRRAEFEPRSLNLRLIDASRLAPPGKSLANIGALVGYP